MLFHLLALLFLAEVSQSQDLPEYGVDCSFPIHSKELRCGNILGDRRKIYEEFMDGCRRFHGDKANRCDETEDDRIEMSLRQPQSMVNYTSTGFKKIRAPKRVMDMLSSYWKANKDNMKQEQWPVGNIYVNHWVSPTYMVSVEDATMEGGGFTLKQSVWEAVRPTIEEWTGMEQEPSSMYGIRAYTEGAILSPHVDRLPLVSSCIINVDQDVDEDWILEVFDRQGRAVNITMAPGDMVLYESGSLLHGRPFPLNGRYYANIFIHFQPTGRPLNDSTNAYLDTLDEIYPPYILPNSPELVNWRMRNPQGWKRPSPSAPIQQFPGPEGHKFAAYGDLDGLKKLVKTNRHVLHSKDENGWLPIHEAARSGHKDIVEFLVKNGADKNVRNGPDKDGSSPLNIALEYLPGGHPVTQYLMSIGAENIEPEL